MTHPLPQSRCNDPPFLLYSPTAIWLLPHKEIISQLRVQCFSWPKSVVWGSVVAAMSLYSADRPRLRLAFLNNTELLKLAGKEKKSQGYCLTKKKKKASKYILKTSAVAFRVCVGNGVILILISFLTAGFVVHVKIGKVLKWEWEVYPRAHPARWCSRGLWVRLVAAGLCLMAK